MKHRRNQKFLCDVCNIQHTRYPKQRNKYFAVVLLRTLYADAQKQEWRARRCRVTE